MHRNLNVSAQRSDGPRSAARPCREGPSWKKAFKYYYIPWKDIGLGGIVVEPTDDLLRLQQELIDAVAPFTEKTGTAAAFVHHARGP